MTTQIRDITPEIRAKMHEDAIRKIEADPELMERAVLDDDGRPMVIMMERDPPINATEQAFQILEDFEYQIRDITQAINVITEGINELKTNLTIADRETRNIEQLLPGEEENEET